jgi:bla regulator protein blaR1
MILNYLSVMWAAIAPALGNQLWQSTLFAITAGLLTLFLRKNHARARYGIWLAASVKFLVPFSLLVNIGSRLAWSRGSAGTNAGLYFAMEEISQPFTQPTMPLISRGNPSTVLPSLLHLLPAILAAVWLCGFVLVVCVWYVRWRRISETIQDAAPLREGREVEALRRLECAGGVRNRTEMLLSRASLEPGIFGMARPVLVWPEGISERLEDAHLEAILAHEVWHVRCHDNLAAAIHMVVEAVFWFHPFVWWLGARLVEERERACDEQVLESGSEQQVYAESILKTCEFCVGSPLACVSGVTGADLKKRIVRIMAEGVARRLDFRRKLLLGAVGLAAVTAPVAFGLVHATQGRAESRAQSTGGNTPVYEVASIKPNKSDNNMVRMMFRPDGFSATGATLQMLVKAAYGVEDNQISGAPNWLQSEKYDIEAKMDSAVGDELRKLNPDQSKAAREHMLQALLADRFKLTTHRETKELSVYALAIAKNGPKLQEAKPGDTYPNGFKGPDGGGGAGMMRMKMGVGGKSELVGQALPMESLARLLSGQLHRTVLDNTRLKGKYDFTLQWAPDDSQGAMFKGAEGGQSGSDSASSPDSSGPTIFTAIQEQLGLKLESQKGPVEIVVIEHVEKPSEN